MPTVGGPAPSRTRGAPVIDERLSIKVHDRSPAKFSVQHVQSIAFGAPKRFANLAHVGNVQINQMPERLEVTRPATGIAFTSLNLALSVSRPSLGCLMGEGFRGLEALPADLNTPPATTSFVECCHLLFSPPTFCAHCVQSASKML